MSFLDMPFQPRMEKEVECPDRIEGWLERLEIKGPDIDESKSGEVVQLEIQTLEPTTPPPRSDLRSVPHDEISPTDTTFSGQSTFERPLRRSSTPTPAGGIRDDDSDATSIDSQDWVPARCKVHTFERLTPPTFALQSSTSTASFDSREAASNADTGEFTAFPDPSGQANLPTQDPNQPRPVWITTCLQCTLAGLPCSRTYPSCSRCKRNDHAEVCLLQRRCFMSEALDPSLMDKSNVPTLLKVQGEDEGLWKRKVELAEELCEKWIAEQEQKNWVLPDICSPRGGWRTRKDRVKEKKVSHPGEGIGRLSFRELYVDMNS